MKHPQIDKYIAEFKKTTRKAGYTQANLETVHFFLQGLVYEIIEDILRVPRPETTRSKLLLQDILREKNTAYRPPFPQRFAF
jgi:hypothetical protein